MASLCVVLNLPNLLHTATVTVIVNVPEHFCDKLMASGCIPRSHSNVEYEAVFADLDICFHLEIVRYNQGSVLQISLGTHRFTVFIEDSCVVDGVVVQRPLNVVPRSKLIP